MEISKHLKELYKHWDKHTNFKSTKNNSSINNEVIKDISYLINERLSIFEKKEKGLTPPYTQDPILSKYRFCNVYREFDRQTIFFHKHLKSIENDFPLWLLNMLFCRSICNTQTISKIGLISFDEKQNQKVYTKLLNLQSPKYGNAYIFPISLIQKSNWKTREQFFCKYYPLVLKDVAKVISNFQNISVVDALKEVLPIFGFNLKFLWTEVLIDVAYQYPEKIDLFKQFPIGPGSIPTMKMLNPNQDPEITNLNMVGLIDSNLKLPTYNGKTVSLSAENWEGIGCEFRKYTNLKNGGGRKRIYKVIS